MRNFLCLISTCILLVSPVSAKKHTVKFSFSPNVIPRTVSLAGTFNNWSTATDFLSDDDDDGVWTVELELEDGEYQYKFVVNGEYWYQDMNNPLSTPDGYGGRNSVIRVGDYDKFLEEAKRGDGETVVEAVYHTIGYPYFVLSDDSTIYLKLRTKKDDIDSCVVLFDASRFPLDWYAFDNVFDYYLAEIPIGADSFSYRFVLYDGEDTIVYDEGFGGNRNNIGLFYIPGWVAGAVFYQIFPERFANGDSSNDPDDVLQWGGKPEYDNFFGGDIKGILEHLDYLSSLGIDAIYLNPIFLSPSNHKYDIADPMKLDPHFGDESILKQLLDSCHTLGIKVIIDGVFHDTGRSHWAFQDVIKNGKDSPFASWYNIHSFPVGPIDEPNYDCWWGFGSLPSLMTDNPDVMRYLFSVVRYWTEFGVDGWRLDCPNEVKQDSFWVMFRDTVRSINPEAYILGEIWGDGSKYLKGDMFDAVMNYRFRAACLDFFALKNISSQEFANRYFGLLASYLPNVNLASFNLLGSHDTKRFLTLCNGDKNSLKLALLFQMSTIGAPSIYYGDEIGMEGGKDPDCRRCFIWNEQKQDRGLLEHIRKLISIRKTYPVLAYGNVYRFETPDENSIILYKKYRNSLAVVVINNGKDEKSFKIVGNCATDLLTGKTYKREALFFVDLPAESGTVLILE